MPARHSHKPHTGSSCSELRETRGQHTHLAGSHSNGSSRKPSFPGYDEKTSTGKSVGCLRGEMSKSHQTSKSDALCYHRNGASRSAACGSRGGGYSRSIEVDTRKDSHRSEVKCHGRPYVRGQSEPAEPVVVESTGVRRENGSFTDIQPTGNQREVKITEVIHVEVKVLNHEPERDTFASLSPTQNGHRKEPEESSIPEDDDVEEKIVNNEMGDNGTMVANGTNVTDEKLHNQDEIFVVKKIYDADNVNSNSAEVNNMNKDMASKMDEKYVDVDEVTVDAVTIVTVPTTAIEIVASPTPSDDSGNEQSHDSDSTNEQSDDNDDVKPIDALISGVKKINLEPRREDCEDVAKQLEKCSISENADEKMNVADQALMKTACKVISFIISRGKRPKYEADGLKNDPPGSGFQQQWQNQYQKQNISQPYVGIGFMPANQPMSYGKRHCPNVRDGNDINYTSFDDIDADQFISGDEVSKVLECLQAPLSEELPVIQVPHQPNYDNLRSNNIQQEKPQEIQHIKVKGDRFGKVTEKPEKNIVMPIDISNIGSPEVTNVTNAFAYVSSPAGTEVTIQPTVTTVMSPAPFLQSPQQTTLASPAPFLQSPQQTTLASPAPLLQSPQQTSVASPASSVYSSHQYHHSYNGHDAPVSPASSEISSVCSSQSAAVMLSPAPSTPASYVDIMSPNSDNGYVTSTTDSDYSNPPSNVSVTPQQSDTFTFQGSPQRTDIYSTPQPVNVHVSEQNYTNYTNNPGVQPNFNYQPNIIAPQTSQYPGVTQTQPNYIHINGQIYMPVGCTQTMRAPIQQYQHSNAQLPQYDMRYVQQQQGMVSDVERSVQSANLNILTKKDEDGDTVLHISIAQRDVNLAKAIIGRLSRESPRVLDSPDNLGQTPLHLAVLTNQPKVIEVLIMNGANVGKCSHEGNTVLHCAVERGFSQAIVAIGRSINQYNATHTDQISLSVDSKNADGLSALHLAVTSHKTPIRVFIDSSPTDIIVDNSEILQILICSMNADVSLPDGKSGKTALHYAAEKGDGEMMRSIFDMVPNASTLVNETMFNGNTALHLVVGSGRKEDEILRLVHILFDYGADPSIENAEKEKAIAYAQKSHSKVKKRLRGHPV